MEGKMNKEQVIASTIDTLMEINVPVRLDDQITQPIKGAIGNLLIVLEMIKVEREANEQPAEDPPEEEKAPENPGGLFEVKPEDDDLYGDGEDEPAQEKTKNPISDPSGSTEGVNARESGEADEQHADDE